MGPVWSVSFDMLWRGSSKQITWDNVLQLTTMDFDGDHPTPNCKPHNLVKKGKEGSHIIVFSCELQL